MKNNLDLKNILGYDDVVVFEPGNSNEDLVPVSRYDSSITNQYIKKDMVPITGPNIYVRETVAQKLAYVESNLRNFGYRLKVVYGYRHPSVQQKYFDDRKMIISKDKVELSGNELDRYTHNFVAVPEIAGHPAGAAVDVTLINSSGNEVDMGTAIADYSDEYKIKTYATNLNTEQAKNRMVLHDLMVNEGFAPFYGEWWHFSYGDREWAAFYNKKALYGAIDFSI